MKPFEIVRSWRWVRGWQSLDVTGRDIDERRLAFGRVAELYDDARPSYPSGLIDAVMEFSGLEPLSPVLEIGAGTGKATRLLAERGLRVLALEPSSEMAELARHNCVSFPLVEIVEIDFERWEAHELFAAVVAAQSWHWITPEERYARARSALALGGALAAFWTFPDWARIEQHDQLGDVYRETAPDFPTDSPIHPATVPTDFVNDWCAEIDESEGLSDSRVQSYEWSLDYTTEEYLKLLQTHQDYILLPGHQRNALLAAIADVVEASGGTLAISLVTHLCLARRNN